MFETYRLAFDDVDVKINAGDGGGRKQLMKRS